MTAKWSGYYKIVQPKPKDVQVTDNQSMGLPSMYGNFSHYHHLINGSSSRLTRYKEYDLMDADVEVSRALDIIAEEITGNNPRTNEPLLLNFNTDKEQQVQNNIILTVQAALNTWNDIHEWDKRLFKLARNTVKYGDCFFRKKNNIDKWSFIPVKTVLAAYAQQDDITQIDAWSVANNIKQAKPTYGVPVNGTNPSTSAEPVPSKEIVRFTLNDDMSENAPFGESVLRVAYRVYKQKELLEDAIIIYRIQRAPERRVFYVDVGKMPSQRIAKHLEQLKNEIKQKKIPSVNGGQNEIDSIYNPQSMCLSLDTKIPLLDGRVLTLSEIIKEQDRGNENWVYSINPKDGNVVPGLISWAGITRKNTETIKITLDNGKTITCTPDHKFPIRGNDGVRVQAKDLTVDDSLFSFNIENTSGSEQIVKIEKDIIQDTGTLTIDAEEKYHNYHTFALDSGVFTFNSEDFFFAQRCIRLNTKIPLLDGRELSLQEIINEHSDGKKNFVNSVDKKTGKLISGEIEWAGLTRKNAELLRVLLDNGECLDCTPDHKIVLQDGSEVEAQHLKENDNVMPLYRNSVKVTSIEYLDFREDTGCLTIKDPGDNHNFAISSGIYIKNSDGKGSRVETLPGGEGLGELSDLDYFQDKLFRALRVPISYMRGNQEGAIYNDGKVGIAYVQEQRFAAFVERIQTYIENVLDSEFKKYLRSKKINIDTTLFNLCLPESANFSIYKQQELDAALLSNFGSLDGVEHLSKRFVLKRYLNLTDEEIALNEQMLKEEKGLNPDHKELQAVYYGAEGGEESGGESGGEFGGEFGGEDVTGDEGTTPEEF